jgi:hypothetical protein
MIIERLTPLGRPLTHWLHVHHRTVPLDDGACPVCDYPFGEMRHVCVGGQDTVIDDRSV